jgi:hypothetical protein
MLATTVTINPPVEIESDNLSPIVLTGQEVRTIIDDLHHPASIRRLPGDPKRRALFEKVWSWIEKDKHQTVWKQIISSLDDTP